MTPRRAVFRLVMALFIVLIAASYAVPLWFQLQGDRLLVVTSGSMEPEIGVGSAVVVRPITEASQLRVGQVVTFWPVTAGSEQGSIMETHRIVALVNVARRSPDTREVVRDSAGNAITDPFIRTKGDSNEKPDANLTPVTQVRGIVRDVHPGWGYLLAWAHSGIGRLLLFGPPLLMLLISELFSRVPERWQRASWNRTLLAIRNREAATGGPLARRSPEGDGAGD
jgi:signal peptidase